MMQQWRLLGLQAVLAGALVAASAEAQIDGPTGLRAEEPKKNSDGEKEPSVSEQLRELRKQLELLNTSIRGLGGAVETDVKRIDKDVKDLKDEVARLRNELNALRGLSATRVSNYPASPAGTARIRLVNTFANPVTIVVNGLAYDVKPNETRFTEPLPLGDVSYEVLGIQTARTTKVTAETPLTINVYTRS
jgi:hypothetical protein